LYIPSVKLDDDLARAVVIDFLELANVTYYESGYVKKCSEELNVANHGKGGRKLVRSSLRVKFQKKRKRTISICRVLKRQNVVEWF
jgi:hypothetical protein